MEIATGLSNAKARVQAAIEIIHRDIYLNGDDFSSDPDIPKEDKKDEDKQYEYGTLTNVDDIIYGINANDIQQGSLGDCYFMAALGSVALANPDLLKNNIHDNGNGTYTVILYEKKDGTLVSVPVIVDGNDFPLNKNGNPAYARFGDTDKKDETREIWPMLYEKAYAQLHGGYDDIEGGKAYEAMEEITGIPSTHVHPADLTFAELQENLNNNAISVSSHNDTEYLGFIENKNDKSDTEYYEDGGPVETQLGDIPAEGENREEYLHSSHAYIVTGTEVVDGEQWVTMRNPWGWERGEIRLTFNQFQEAFKRVDINPTSET